MHSSSEHKKAIDQTILASLRKLSPHTERIERAYLWGHRTTSHWHTPLPLPYQGHVINSCIILHYDNAIPTDPIISMTTITIAIVSITTDGLPQCPITFGITTRSNTCHITGVPHPLKPHFSSMKMLQQKNIVTYRFLISSPRRSLHSYKEILDNEQLVAYRMDFIPATTNKHVDQISGIVQGELHRCMMAKALLQETDFKLKFFFPIISTPKEWQNITVLRNQLPDYPLLKGNPIYERMGRYRS